MSLVKLRLCILVVRAYHLSLCAQLVERRHPNGDLAHTQLIAQNEEFLRRLRLLSQRLDLKLKLVYLVVYAQKVFLGFRKLALGFLLAAAVARYAGGLLKDLAAVGALIRHDLRYLALTYDGVAVAAESRVHKKAVYVLKAHRLAVYVILAVAAAVIAAGKHELGVVAIENVLGVVNNKRDLRKAERAALFRAAEDDVFHFAAAQGLGALLAHDPKYRVGYI